MTRASWTWSAIFVVAGGAATGCTALLGDFKSSGGASDASVESSVVQQDEGGGQALDAGGQDVTTSSEDAGEDSGTDAVAQEAAACMTGEPCAAGPCLAGFESCEGGAATCTPLAMTFNGTKCDAGAVCNGGSCVACNTGAACGDAGACKLFSTSCITGSPACIAEGNAPNGSSCGANLYCDNGTCAACTNGAPCTPPNNACHTGTSVCADGGVTCTDTGHDAAAGTTCGTNEVCDGNGACVACTAGTSCNPGGNVCQSGVTSCASGSSTCTAPANVADGTPCGTNMVCSGGGCVACTAGMACNPGGNACETGMISCSTGVPTCTVDVTTLTNGTSCGTNMVCDNAVCSACTANASCHPSGNLCATGTTSCTTGVPVCSGSAQVANGTSCGTNEVCDNGACTACTAGTACHPGGNLCENAVTSCATGVSACTASVANVANGTSCGVSSYCLSGTCTATQDYGYPGFASTCVAGTTPNTPWSPSYLFGTSVTVPSAVIATGLGVAVTSVTSYPLGSVEVYIALYTNTTANVPGTLVASTADATVVSGANELAIPPVSLAAGTYWVLADYSVAAAVCTNGVTSASYDYASLSFAGAPPSTYPAATSYSSAGVPANYIIAY